MRRKKGMSMLLLLTALGLLAGCGTSAADNTKTYFSEVASVLDTWFASSKDQSVDSEGEEAQADAGEKLKTPEDFTLDEEGNYSFTGVENADYYLMYFCASDAVNDTDAFLYSSDTLDASGEGGETYTGNVDDLLRYGYGEYLVKVFAFPSVNDSEHAMSAAATASFSCSGSQDAPVIDYMWNTFDNTVEVQLSNIGDYMYQCYPDSVEVTFTNTADESDSVVVIMEELSAENNSLVSDALTRGVTYAVSAVSKSDSEYVQNSVSDTTQVTEGVTFGDSNVISENYFYTDGIARATFSYPQVCQNFKLSEGGAMNTPDTSVNFTFTAAAAEAKEGCAYSYTVTADNKPFAVADATLDLYTDGTFLMCQNSEMPPEGPSTIKGIWAENGDGTATLSFDHATLTTSVD